MTESETPEPKIVVDTDWKEQVAKEKEAATKQAEESESTPEASSDELTAKADDFVPAPSKAEAAISDEMPPPPKASFEMVVSMFFTQAMAMLGQIPNPTTGTAEINKPYAKHYIDTLDVLGEKTKGNLTSDESKMLSEALHALRMMYVNVKQPAK